MKLTFIGAAHEVTGSCHFLQAAGKNILIDCGMAFPDDEMLGVDIVFSFFSHPLSLRAAAFPQKREGLFIVLLGRLCGFFAALLRIVFSMACVHLLFYCIEK